MANRRIIDINNIESARYWKMNNFEKLKELEKEYREKIKQLKEQLKNKEQECDKLKRVLAKISDIAELFCNTY